MQIVLFFAKRRRPVGSFMTHILRLVTNLFSIFSHVSLEASQSVRPALKSYFIFKSAVFPKCRCLISDIVSARLKTKPIPADLNIASFDADGHNRMSSILFRSIVTRSVRGGQRSIT